MCCDADEDIIPKLSDFLHDRDFLKSPQGDIITPIRSLWQIEEESLNLGNNYQANRQEGKEIYGRGSKFKRRDIWC